MTTWPVDLEKGLFVRDLFSAVFGRKPAEAPESAYIERINSGRSVGKIVLHALRSDEASKSGRSVSWLCDLLETTVIGLQLTLDELQEHDLLDVFALLHRAEKLSDTAKPRRARNGKLSCNLRLEIEDDISQLRGWIVVPTPELDGTICTIRRGSEVVAQLPMMEGINPIAVEHAGLEDPSLYVPISCSFERRACETITIDPYGSIAGMLDDVVRHIPPAPMPALFDDGSTFDELTYKEHALPAYLALAALSSGRFNSDDVTEDGNIAPVLQWFLFEWAQAREAPPVLPLSKDLIEFLNRRAVDERLTMFPVPVSLMLLAQQSPEWIAQLFGTSEEFRALVSKMFATRGFEGGGNHRLVPESVAGLLKEQHPDSSNLAFPMNWFWYLDQVTDAATRDGKFQISDQMEVPHQLRIALAKSLESILHGKNLEFIPTEWQALLSELADPIYRRLVRLARGYDRSGRFNKVEHADDELDDEHDDAQGVATEHAPKRESTWIVRNPGVRLFHPEQRWRLQEQSLSVAMKELTREHWDFLGQRLWLLGHDGTSGLANNRRMFEGALKASGATPSSVFVDRRELVDQLAAARSTGATLDRPVIIAALNADRYGITLPRLPNAMTKRATKIGFFLWETSVPPPTHVCALPFADEIWTPSDYVRQIYAPHAPEGVQVVNIKKHIEIPRDVEPMSRSSIGVGKDDFVFLLVADFESSIIRKHPLPVLRAFRRAFPASRTDVKLIVKVRRVIPTHWSNQGGYWNLVQREMNLDPRIKLLAGNLPGSGYWSLLKTANCFVTLHRSEGFGYGPAHSLGLGVPVISANYSGVTDFCTDETAFMVDTAEVPVLPHQVRSRHPVGVWGEPSIDHAAEQMRRVVEDQDEARKRARAGQELVLREYSLERFSKTLRERLTRLGVQCFDDSGIAPAASSGRVSPDVPIAMQRLRRK